MKNFEVGPATVYGEWDDVTDTQFIVIWGEAGPTCTVILLSGFDYGGGITSYSSNVPVKKAEEVINSSLSDYETKKFIEELVKEFP